jgi:hypothetical protein
MLVLSVLEYANSHAQELADLIKKAEADTVSEITANNGTLQKGVQYKAVQLEEKPIELLKRETYVDNSSGKPQTRPTGRLLIVQNVSNMNRFEPTKSSVVPRGYAFPPELKKTADKLQEHGVKVEIAAKDVQCTGEEYIISKYAPGRAYQGVSMITMEGAFQKVERAIPAGWYLVDLTQPLGYLTFYLLEPETDDGLAVWGHFTEYLTAKGVDKGGIAYPVLKYYSRNDRK